MQNLLANASRGGPFSLGRFVHDFLHGEVSEPLGRGPPGAAPGGHVSLAGPHEESTNGYVTADRDEEGSHDEKDEQTSHF